MVKDESDVLIFKTLFKRALTNYEFLLKYKKKQILKKIKTTLFRF